MTQFKPVLDERFSTTEYVVEATLCEAHNIWFRWCHIFGVVFEQDPRGLSYYDVVDVGGRRMCVDVTWSIVAGMRTAFVALTTGLILDYGERRAWLGFAFPCLSGPNGWHERHSDATNFGNYVIADIGRRQGRPVPRRNYGEIEAAIRRVPIR